MLVNILLGCCVVFLFPFWVANSLLIAKTKFYSIKFKMIIGYFFAGVQLVTMALFSYFTYYQLKHSVKNVNDVMQFDYALACKYGDYAGLTVIVGLTISLFIFLVLLIPVVLQKVRLSQNC